jgi:lysyl-tRNA synthetase class 2
VSDDRDTTDAHAGDVAASRAEKLRRIEALGLDPWGGRFDGHVPVAEILSRPCVSFDENPTEKVRAAGRVVLRRDMGKAHFLHLHDQTGRIQLWIGQKQVGEPGWELAQLLDLGDLIGVDGTLGKTRKGEPTIRVEGLTFLAKSLEPHPEKYHGMHDEEYRLRHRYLDLIYTPETLTRAQQRVKIVRTIRNFLSARGYLEVETPALHSVASGAAARPFVTHHNALDIDLFLRIALELHLKRLLVGGIEKVYEIGRVFRNEGISRKHNPEFTMLELYQAYGDYHTMMDLTQELIIACVDTILGRVPPVGHNYSLAEYVPRDRILPYGERHVNFNPPWKRETYSELFRQHVGVSLDDAATVVETARERGIEVAGKDPDVVIQELFERYVEDQLDGPVFVYDYPAALCPLTKRKRDNPRLAERFELYICGMELANAYTELNDPAMQEVTFRQQLAGLKEEDSMARMDEDFVQALRYAMPPAGGLGIGIDRLVMLLTNAATIRDVILFPLLKPEK